MRVLACGVCRTDLHIVEGELKPLRTSLIPGHQIVGEIIEGGTFDYDRLLWGERQIRSVANMTRADARDFLKIAAEMHLQPKITTFALDQANEALAAIKNDSIDGAAVILP
jgi:D-arabinose 1-dehydrogenase-like Zn-dependent alcohol dehydrogenase